MKPLEKTVLVPPLAFDPQQKSFKGALSLGSITIATILRQAGHQAHIADFSVPISGKDEEQIIGDLAQRIMESNPDTVGFSTVCGFFPLTLLVAQACKAFSPGVKIVLGGPQASVTHGAVLQHCPWVDVVVLGEADLTVARLWAVLGREAEMAEIPGIAFKADGGLRETGPAPRVADLDDLPIPDYDLAPEQLRLWHGVTPIEAGRGCPYGCSFCSTNSFWGRKSRAKSPERIHREIVGAQAGIKGDIISLVHDMIAGNRDVLQELCVMLSQLPERPRWECAARLDHLDAELLAAMAAAGCVAIFVGLESASQRGRDLVGKGLDFQRALATVRMIRNSGINPIVSFVIGFPDETEADLLETVSLALDLRCRLGFSSNVFMHLLAPMHNTPMFNRFKDRLVLGPLLNPDMCFFTFHAPQCMAMMRDHPDICSAGYHFRGGPIQRGDFVAMFLVLKQLLRCYHTLRLLRRLYGPGLARRLYGHLDRFSLADPETLHFADRLQDQTERCLEALFAPHERTVPYWRDLYGYEAGRIVFDQLESQGKRQGVRLRLAYDVRKILDLLEGPEDLPALSPMEDGLHLWLVAIGDRQLEVALPPALAAGLG